MNASRKAATIAIALVALLALPAVAETPEQIRLDAEGVGTVSWHTYFVRLSGQVWGVDLIQRLQDGEEIVIATFFEAPATQIEISRRNLRPYILIGVPRADLERVMLMVFGTSGRGQLLFQAGGDLWYLQRFE